jgi:hypothetical protein
MTGSVGKLSRGSLSHNKSYKPDGRKAYARAALKCTCNDTVSPRAIADPRTQTTSALPSMAHYVPSSR